MINQTRPPEAHTYPSYITEVDGVPIHYVKVGSGPGLVMIHGLTNNWYGWGPLIPFLMKSFTLYLIDLPGYGNSGDLPEYSIDIQSEYVIKLMDSFEEYPIGVVGMSMGSLLTAQVGTKIGHKLSGIVMAGPVLNVGRTGYFTKGMELLMRGATQTDLTTNGLKRIVETRAMAYALSKYLNMYRFNRALIDEYGMEGKRLMRAKAYPPMSISVSRFDAISLLREYQHPVLMIYGKQDRASAPKSAYDHVLPVNPNVSCVEIDEAGHLVPVEKPQEVSESIVQFFSE